MSLMSLVNVQADELSGDEEGSDYAAENDADDDANDADADDDDDAGSDVDAKGDMPDVSFNYIAVEIEFLLYNCITDTDI